MHSPDRDVLESHYVNIGITIRFGNRMWKELAGTVLTSTGDNMPTAVVKIRKRNGQNRKDIVFPINSMVLGKSGGNGDRQTFGIGDEGDRCPTLQARHSHACAIVKKTFGIDQQGGKGGANYTEDVAPTICSDSHGTPHGVAQVVNHGKNPIVLNFMGCKGNNAVTQDGTSPTVIRCHGNDMHIVCVPRRGARCV